MQLSMKKVGWIVGASLLLTACQPNGPTIESLQQLRDVDSGIEITNSRIKSVTPVNDTLSLYDIEGMFKYRDGRYEYLTEIGGVEIYTPLNGEEATPFNASIIASELNDAWTIESENLPEFVAPNNIDEKILNHTTLFDGTTEEVSGIYQRADGSRFLLNTNALDTNVKDMIKAYENQLKQNVELDEKLIDLDDALASRKQDVVEKLPKVESANQNALTSALKQDEAYQTALAKREAAFAEITKLHNEMPKFWAVTQCYDTRYRFHGRICNQIAGVNRDYLPKIRYSSRPDADPKYITVP